MTGVLKRDNVAHIFIWIAGMIVLGIVKEQTSNSLNLVESKFSKFKETLAVMFCCVAALFILLQITNTFAHCLSSLSTLKRDTIKRKESIASFRRVVVRKRNE